MKDLNPCSISIANNHMLGNNEIGFEETLKK